MGGSGMLMCGRIQTIGFGSCVLDLTAHGSRYPFSQRILQKNPYVSMQSTRRPVWGKLSLKKIYDLDPGFSVIVCAARDSEKVEEMNLENEFLI
jgi:hypothetical protein